MATKAAEDCLLIMYLFSNSFRRSNKRLREKYVDLSPNTSKLQSSQMHVARMFYGTDGGCEREERRGERRGGEVRGGIGVEGRREGGRWRVRMLLPDRYAILSLTPVQTVARFCRLSISYARSARALWG